MGFKEISKAITDFLNENHQYFQMISLKSTCLFNRFWWLHLEFSIRFYKKPCVCIEFLSKLPSGLSVFSPKIWCLWKHYHWTQLGLSQPFSWLPHIFNLFLLQLSSIFTNIYKYKKNERRLFQLEAYFNTSLPRYVRKVIREVFNWKLPVV